MADGDARRRERTLDLLAPFPDIGQDGRNAALGDGLDAARRDEQGHPALLFGHPEALVVQVGLEPPPGFAVGVADVVSVGDRLAGDNAAAEKEFQEAVRIAPRDMQAWTGLFSCYLQSRQLSEALETLNQSVEQADLSNDARKLVQAQGRIALG